MYQKKIDTYETSIQPYEDCCTIFVAKHPVTKPNIDVIRRSEENLNEKIDELMKQAIETVEIIEVKINGSKKRAEPLNRSALFLSKSFTFLITD